MLKFEHDRIFIKLFAKEVVKEMMRLKENKPEEPEYLNSKAAAEYLGISEDYIRKIKHKLPYLKQGTKNQGRLVFLKEGLFEAYTETKKTSNKK